MYGYHIIILHIGERLRFFILPLTKYARYLISKKKVSLQYSYICRGMLLTYCSSLLTALRCHRLGYRLISQSNLWYEDSRSLGELNSQILNASQVLFGTFPLRAHVPFFQISYYSHIILLSVSYSCFILAVSMFEVYCMGYTPRACNPRSLQSMLNGPLYFF